MTKFLEEIYTEPLEVVIQALQTYKMTDNFLDIKSIKSN